MIKLEMNKAMQRAVARAAQAKNFVALLQDDEYLVISGKSEAEYNVKFVKQYGAVWAECTCAAGREAMACHHIVSAGWLHKGIIKMRKAAQPATVHISTSTYEYNSALGRTLNGWQV